MFDSRLYNILDENILHHTLITKFVKLFLITLLIKLSGLNFTTLSSSLQFYSSWNVLWVCMSFWLKLIHVHTYISPHFFFYNHCINCPINVLKEMFENFPWHFHQYLLKTVIVKFSATYFNLTMVSMYQH